MTNVELLTIGDELLIGQVVNTNSAWMGVELNKAGFVVKQITSVSDNANNIIQALDLADKRADVILITGGLGPTKDDITKHTLCKYFNTPLVFDEKAYALLEERFARYGRKVSETNRHQAELPQACTPIYNKNGTACGMVFERENKMIVSMPGVPFEMKAMMTNDVIPMLRKKYKPVNIVHKTVLTQGIGESDLSDKIAAWETSLPANMKLAYLPAPGMVRLRLSAIGDDKDLEEKTTAQINLLTPLITQYVYGYEDITIEEVVGKLLTSKNKSLAIAESCTGGYVSHLITSVPGSSKYFIGSVLSYANKIKCDELGVDAKLFETVGAVSEEVVKQMAEGVRRKFGADYSIATSGIAGPAGGSEWKPVGTVCIAISSEQNTITKKFLLGNERLRIISVASQTALNMLRKMVEAENP